MTDKAQTTAHGLDELEQRITTLAAQIDAATCRLLELILELDKREGWAHQHARSCVEWLGWRLGWNRCMASERLRVAHKLDELPALHGAFSRGELSYSKVRAITRIATAQDQEKWLDIAMSSTAAVLEKIVRRCRRANQAEDLAHEEGRQQARFLNTYFDDAGMLVLNGRLPPEAGAAVSKALEAAFVELRREQKGVDLGGEAKADFVQLRADALERLAERALGNGEPKSSADHRQIVVHVDAEILVDPSAPGRSELEDGPSLSAETARRISCDASLVTMVHDGEGKVLHVGRKSRVIHTPLRRALKERDGGCRFPGCSAQYVEGHHVLHWADGGETELGNIVTLCKFHHGLLHEKQYAVSLDNNGVATFFAPDGEPIPAVTQPPSFRGNSEQLMARLTDEAGLTIHAETNLPYWDGEPPDYDWITTVMTYDRPSQGEQEWTVGLAP